MTNTSVWEYAYIYMTNRTHGKTWFKPRLPWQVFFLSTVPSFPLMRKFWHNIEVYHLRLSILTYLVNII